MSYYCPTCGENFEITDQAEAIPAVCPECGADLYPEEILFQQMISAESANAALV